PPNNGIGYPPTEVGGLRRRVSVTAVMGALAVAALVGVTGVVLTMVAIGRRKKSWPLAAGTLGLCVVVLFGGFVGYFVAVGG
ncbi:MAG: hypothetical protein O2892_09230, partial [Actinomycetota bacterium]|nr:hypothetical protein [Actinomycetota bacterium]